jgi:hypothetical protein
LKRDPIAPGVPGALDEQSDGDSTGKSAPPADDAPIKELIAYWAADRDSDAANLSEKVRWRLLEACEDRPELLIKLIAFLPESADTYDRLYQLLDEDFDPEDNWKPFLRKWLRRHSVYFRDALIEAARASDDAQDDAVVDLQALARLDWAAARPILEAFASSGKAFVAPCALALLYEHAAQESNSTQAESYRALLKAIVANPQASWSARVEVLTSLLKTEWGGQEEWFASLFADPTLSNIEEDEIESAGSTAESGADLKGELSEKPSAKKEAIAIEDVPVAKDVGFRWEFQPGILATVLYGNTILHGAADRWFPVVTNLVNHNQPTVHRAAVKCLVKSLLDDYNWRKPGGDQKKKDVVRLLSPMLMDPAWANSQDRSEFIGMLKDVQMPALIPGLIWILNHDKDSNNRAKAAEALAKYRDPSAIPALRHALEREKDEENREKIVIALVESGGLSDDEIASAIEAHARLAVTEKGEEELLRAGLDLDESEKALPINVSIGLILRERETIQTMESLAVKLIERAKARRATEPAIARKILRAIEASPLPVVQANLVERIGEGWIDLDALVLALKKRDSLRNNAGVELNRLIKQGGYAAGVGAAILDDGREADGREGKALLAGADQKAQLALLACARYLRDKLPVEIVGKSLDSPNLALAKAAENYLWVEDSAEARKLILARHPGEAYILGDLTAVGAEPNLAGIRGWEESLRQEIRSQNGLEAIYAVLRKYSAENFAGVIVRVRDGKAELSVYETEGRRNARWLTADEFEELKRFTARSEIEGLGPESYIEETEQSRLNFEYLRLTKDGGRRIALDALRRQPKSPTPHESLSGLFYRLSRSGEFKARYAIEEKIPGVEVLFADKKISVEMVCGEGREIRALLVENGSSDGRKEEKGQPEWRLISSGAPGELTDAPQACPMQGESAAMLKDTNSESMRRFDPSQRAGDSWFYFQYKAEPGIWKASPGNEPLKILDGVFSAPVVTPDGKWLVATKISDGAVNYGPHLIRYNLETGKEFTVRLPIREFTYPAVYVPAHHKILLGSPTNDTECCVAGQNYLLDPETGMVQIVRGEFRPLQRGRARLPQPTGNPNEFWATIYDPQKRVSRLGRYDPKTFSFTPLLEFPDLRLTSDDVWVDAGAGKIWITYQGQLLRLPLPAQAK